MPSGGVVFDLDETLLDRSASIDVYANLLWEDFQDQIRQDRGEFTSTFVQLDGNGYTARDVVFRSLAEITQEIPATAFERHFREHAWSSPVPMPFALEGLRRLRQASVPVGIVTNGGSANQRQKLKSTGLGDLVDVAIVSEEFGRKKPDTEIFLEVARRLRINPHESWFVGDHPVLDIWGSTRVGFRAVWIRRTVPWPSDYEPCYTKAVESFAEALRVVEPAA